MEKSITKKRKHMYRLPPCPAYDIEGTESWLSHMAGKGYRLSKDSFFIGFAEFEKTKPLTLRYRLEPAPQKISIWSDTSTAPSKEAIELNAFYGWQYITSRGQFFIYCSEQPDARELNTDPQIQALAINMLRKRERTSLLTGIFWMLLNWILSLHGKLLLMAVNTGSWFVLGGFLLFLWAFLRCIIKVFHLRNLRKKLMNGKRPDHKKNWKRHARRYQLSRFSFILLLILWIFFFLKGWNKDVMDSNIQTLESGPEGMPFATMADLAPDGVYRLNNRTLGNTIELSSDWLAPVIINLQEDASIQISKNKYLNGYFYVNYYKTAAPWIAREIAREFLLEDKQLKNYSSYDIPDLGIDYAAAYCTYFPTIILQQGNTVIRASFYQNSETYTKPFQEWVQVLADSIR